LIAEKDGSFTINCNQGEITMSTRNFGIGKSYRTASEAFKDATYATAITRPEKGHNSHLWAVSWVLAALGLLAYLSSRF